MIDAAKESLQQEVERATEQDRNIHTASCLIAMAASHIAVNGETFCEPAVLAVLTLAQEALNGEGLAAA